MQTRMGREVEVYSDWTDDPSEKNRYRSGSGYLLGGRLAVTAAHVVCPTRHVLASVAIQVRTGAGPDLLSATVVWRHPDPEVDVALLEITDPGWRTPVWRHRVRWGHLVTTRARQRCEATGFPKVTATPAYRDTHTADGLINPKALAKSARYAVDVINPPDGPDLDGSWWAGMSGAGVLCNDLLVAVVVVVEDPAGFNSRRLITIPLASVITDPDFRRLVTTHCGRPPVLEPVELAGLAEPVRAPDSPAGLLRADVADTPFRDRPELEQLRRWCQLNDWSSTRLVAGPGGQGKTRLARHLAAQQASEGWATVMLAERAGAAEIAVLGEVASRHW
jgi:hypothetical protein